MNFCFYTFPLLGFRVLGVIFFLHGHIPCTLKNPIKKVTLATVRRDHTVRRVYTQRNTEREIIGISCVFKLFFQADPII